MIINFRGAVLGILHHYGAVCTGNGKGGGVNPEQDYPESTMENIGAIKNQNDK